MIIKVKTYSNDNEYKLKRIFITELNNYLFDAYEDGFRLNNVGLQWNRETAKEYKEWYLIEAYKNCLDEHDKQIKIVISDKNVEIVDNWW